MNSIWDSTVTVPTYPALHQNITADAAVIGGGIAGILIAYQLEKKGIHAVVLERDRIWGGQRITPRPKSQRSTACATIR